MRRSLSAILLLGSAALLACCRPAGGGDDAAAREIPARQLPVPSDVSPELAAMIAEPLKESPVPRTPEEWREMEVALDTPLAADVRKLAEAVGATLEETAIAGVRCVVVVPKEIPAANKSRLLVHLHGGGYVFGGGPGCALEAVLVANAAKTKTVSVDYRMPPDHPFPAALDDAVAVWKELAEKNDPAKMAMFGTSAGGGLTMATAHKLKDLSLPLPAALFLGTPAGDITKTGDTYFANAGADNSIGQYEGIIEESLKLYAGGADMKNPLLSPVYGDFRGFPPAILVSGTRDLLLSDTVRVHRKMRQAGVPAELHVFEGQSHADYIRAFESPESKDAFDEVARFFDKHLGK